MKLGKYVIQVMLVCMLCTYCTFNVQALDSVEYAADSSEYINNQSVLEDGAKEDIKDLIFTDSVVEQLESLIKAQNFESSVWIKDLDTGEEFIYNPDKLYYSASIIKAPYSLWLCTQADKGKIDLSGEIKNYSSLCGDSKWIGQYKNDAYINTWTCIDAMIYASDNDATAILSHTWPVNYGDEFNDFLHNTLNWSSQSKGQVSNNVTNGYLTVTDASNLLEYLYNYFEESGTNGPRLKESYIQANHSHLWVPDDVDVAKKYGSWENAFHDIAIVYAKHPYMIACMTNSGVIGSYREDAKQYMTELGKLAYEATQVDRFRLAYSSEIEFNDPFTLKSLNKITLPIKQSYTNHFGKTFKI